MTWHYEDESARFATVNLGLDVERILEAHGHMDHIGALNPVKDKPRRSVCDADIDRRDPNE